MTPLGNPGIYDRFKNSIQKLNPIRRVALAACSLAFCQPALAAGGEASGGLESGFFEELPIVLTASRLPQSLRDAPAAVTVIDRDLIRASGYRDIARLFRLVPGMQVGQERAGTQWVTYHGLGGNASAEMQVLVDGRAVYSPTSLAGLDWQSLPVSIDEIERIEVVRGTDPVAYGPNAFLGAINIITRHAADTPGYETSIHLGNASIADVHVNWSGRQEDHALRLAAVSRQDQGFKNLKDGSRLHLISLRSDSRISLRDELTLRLSAVHDSRDAGYPDSLFGNNDERVWSKRGASFQAQWRHSGPDSDEYLVNLFSSRLSDRDQWVALGPRPDLGYSRPAVVPVNRDYDNRRDSLEFQHRSTLGPSSKVVWGAEAREESADSAFMFYETGAVSSRLLRVFGNLEQRLSPKLTTNLGGMAEKYSDDQTRYSPRLFFNWQAGAETTLRAGLARAWLDRNAQERYGDVRAVDALDGRLITRLYLPNPNLRPPRIDSAELGYLGRFQPGNTTLDVRLFQERIRDFVIREIQPATADSPLLASVMPSTRYENLSSPLVLRGIEYELRSRLGADTQILFSHSLIHRDTDNEAVAELISPYTASLTWMQNWGRGWSSYFTLLRMGPLAGGEGFVPRSRYRSEAYTTADLRLAKRLTRGGQQVELAVSAINLGPKHQEIADRSEQFLHPEGPVNEVSPMIFFSLSIASGR